MKLLVVLLALAGLAVAQQLPLEMDPRGIIGVPHGIVGGYDTDVDITGPYKLGGGIFGGQPRGIVYDRNPYATPMLLPYKLGLPSYGPFVRYGNTVVPFGRWPTTATPYEIPQSVYGNRFNNPIGPFTPVGHPMNPILEDPMMKTMVPSRFGSPVIGPYTPYIMAKFRPTIEDPWLKTISKYGDEFNPIGSNYETEMDPLNPYSQINPVSSGGFTPFSQAALFNLITRGGVGKLDLYSKLILGRSTGLNRKMREVCPEVDGGLSYVSCLTDAHSQTFRCLKGVETHPRYLTCTHKPLVKKVMRDWYVTDFAWHKEIVKCMSTTTQSDKIVEKISGIPVVPPEDKLESSSSDSSSDDQLNSVSAGSKLGWNIELGVSIRQCFYKLRKSTTKCSQLASQCPKFKKCYIHPTVKTLELRKNVKQAKFVKLLDSCLAGAIIPEEIVPEDITPIDPTDDVIDPDILMSSYY